MMTQCIEPLCNLTCFIVEAMGTLDLMNGQLWEEYLLQSRIRVFHFKFTLTSQCICEENQTSLLQSFRSEFWLRKRHWYVACEKGHLKSSRPTIYSIPYFQSSLVFYPSTHVLPMSTAVDDTIVKHPIHLIITFYRTITIPARPFADVHSLTLLTSTLPSIDILQSIVHLHEVKELDISLLKHVSIDDLHILLNHMNHVSHIKMSFHPLIVTPLRIDSFTFICNDDQIFVLDMSNIDRFCYLFFHVKHLEISVRTKMLISYLVNRLHYLELVKIFCYQDSLKDIGYVWLLENMPRLVTMHFSYRVTTHYLVLSIGYPKVSDLCISSNGRQTQEKCFSS
jgi:hypothetical protein